MVKLLTIKALGVILWVAKSILVLTLFYFLSAIVLSSIPVNSGYAQSTDQDSVEIFVTSNGVHTDFVLPVTTTTIDWRRKFPIYHFKNVDSSYQFISFGWGDRKFYMQTPQWKDLTFETAITAALWPTPSAMHVEYIRHSLKPTKSQQPIYLTTEQYKKLVTYIESSFQQENGDLKHIPNTGYTQSDTFYEANEKFYILKNCNNWVNGGLKATGLKAALWAPIPYAVMRHLR